MATDDPNIPSVPAMRPNAATLVGHSGGPGPAAMAPMPLSAGAAPPALAPEVPLAFAATVPAVSAPPSPRHPATLDLLEHNAETLATLTPEQIRALISASSDQWSACSWTILTKLEGEQRSAVPVAFYRAVVDQVIARGSLDEFNKVPRWVMDAACVMTGPRARTMAEIADVSRVRGRSYTAIVVTVTLAILLGIYVVVKMFG